VDSVHGSVDRAGVADDRGSPELGLTTTPGRSGLPRGWQQEGRDVARLGDRPPGLGRRRGGGAPAAGLRLQAAMAWAQMRRGGGEVKG
jgi:hypothetical protein